MTTQTADSLAIELEKPLALRRHIDEAAAMLRSQAAEIERLKNVQAMHSALAEAHSNVLREVERLTMALRSAMYLVDENKLTCHNLHHSTKDFHEWDEPCKVEAMAKQRYESMRSALGWVSSDAARAALEPGK